MRCAGIILCGGRSSRMGLSKAMLPFGPERLLQRVVRLLRQAVDEIVVVAAPRQQLPELTPEVRIVYDRAEGRGPMEGMFRGLSSLPWNTDEAFVSGCDVPFLVPGFVVRLTELLGGHAIAVPFSEGYHQPLAAVYRREVAVEIERLLKAGQRCPLALFDVVPTRFVSVPELVDVDPELATLQNLNRPEEYLIALQRAGFPLSPEVAAGIVRLG